MSLPNRVTINEVGPRDGLQMESQVLPTQTKLELIAALTEAGLPAIQVASFVHPKRVPQMADAVAVIEGLPKKAKAQYSALTLNLKGMQRALETSIPCIEVSLSVHEAHGQKNSGMSVVQAKREIGLMIAAALNAGRNVRATIQCSFGCTSPSDVTVNQVQEMAKFLVDQGIDLLVPADTTGMAAPVSIEKVLNAVLPVVGSVPIGLHLHDTRGLGLVNVATALQMGISHFDTSLGGLGGCPFIENAAGNVATEDTVHLMHSFGIDTGIDLSKVAVWSRRLSDILGRSLVGKMYKLS